MTEERLQIRGLSFEVLGLPLPKDHVDVLKKDPNFKEVYKKSNRKEI